MVSTGLRVGITGADGLLGWHLRCHLFAVPGFTVVPAGRDQLASAGEAAAFVSQCDAIVHFAGMNRGEEHAIEQTNIGLAERLVEAFDSTAAGPHVVYANSIQHDRDTAYGRSKRRAAEILRAWSERQSRPFTDLVLPHVFGEDGRPFYNSVVSTFCFQVAREEQPTVENDADLELVHTQDVADLIVRTLTDKTVGEVRCVGHAITVSQLLATVQDMASEYRNHHIPDLRRPFDRALFSTLRSYLFPSHYPVSLTLRTDPRGSLFEAVKSDNGGQSFMSTTRPGFTRGEHFHLRKFERFLVVDGHARIRVRRMFSDRVHTFDLTGVDKQYVDMPSLYTHDITNIGAGELLTLFWTDEIFSPDAPDTIPEPV